MKNFWKEFIFRGLIAASGGSIVLAVIYWILGATNTVTHFSPNEVSLGIVSITLLAFIVAGMTAIYQMEQLPLLSAIMIHGATLYAVYIVIYLLNGWLKNQLIPIAFFTAIFLLGYAVIWLLIYLFTKGKTNKLNQKLNS